MPGHGIFTSVEEKKAATGLASFVIAMMTTTRT